MWKIYDVTNGLAHTFCNDIATARKVLAAIYEQIRRLAATKGSVAVKEPSDDEFTYYTSFYKFTYEIKEVDVWNTIPDNLKKYAE